MIILVISVAPDLHASSPSETLIIDLHTVCSLQQGITLPCGRDPSIDSLVRLSGTYVIMYNMNTLTFSSDLHSFSVNCIVQVKKWSFF